MSIAAPAVLAAREGPESPDGRAVILPPDRPPREATAAPEVFAPSGVSPIILALEEVMRMSHPRAERPVTGLVWSERIIWGLMVVATLAGGLWGVLTHDWMLMASAIFAAVIVGGMANIVWDRWANGDPPGDGA